MGKGRSSSHVRADERRTQRQLETPSETIILDMPKVANQLFSRLFLLNFAMLECRLLLLSRQRGSCRAVETNPLTINRLSILNQIRRG